MLTSMPHPSPHPCACGCGGMPSKGAYLRGHYTRVTKQTSHREHDCDDYPGDDNQPARASLLNRPAGQLIVAVFSEAWEYRGECPHRQAGVWQGGSQGKGSLCPASRLALCLPLSVGIGALWRLDTVAPY